MNAYYYFFILIVTINFVYAQLTGDETTVECLPVNTLLEKDGTYNCCMDKNIECENGHITIIDLGRNHLNGTIPSELGNLSQLKKLDLSNNDLSGNIPPELGKLSNLEELILNDNGLTGSIPPELGNLTNLKQLWLNNNKLSGSVPSELGKLTELKSLNLNNNELSGTVPQEIGKLSNLMTITIYGNNDLKVDDDFCDNTTEALKNDSFLCYEPKNNGLFSPQKIIIYVLFILLDIFFVYSIFYKRSHKDKFINNSNLRYTYYTFVVIMTIINVIVFLLILFIVIFIASWTNSHTD